MGTSVSGTAERSPSFTKSQFRGLAEEMRAMASCASSERDREGLLHAADNYERLATTLEMVERSAESRPK